METWTAEADLWLELTSEVRVAKDCIAEAGTEENRKRNFYKALKVLEWTFNLQCFSPSFCYVQILLMI